MYENSCVPTPGIEPRGRHTYACANPHKVIAAGLHAYFEAYLAENKRLLANNDHRCVFKHLKSTAGLEGTEVWRGNNLGTRVARSHGMRCKFVNDGQGFAIDS